MENNQFDNACTPLSELDSVVVQAAEKAMNNDHFTQEEIDKFLGCEVNLNVEYPMNEFIFCLDDVPVISMGDIHTIGAKQKAGKSSLVSIFIAAMLGGRWHRLKCNVADIRALYIDTEMNKRDTKDLGLKAATMAEVDAQTLSEHVCLVNLRPLTPAEMEQAIKFYMAKYKPNIVFIDGIVDLCSNFNDVEASQNLVLNFLMKLADEYKCAFINVLHTNKTDGYTELRGHLGAFFEQKGATVIKCEKDENKNLVTVKFATHRYAPVPDFHFTFDENGTPICADSIHQEMESRRKQLIQEQKAVEKQALFDERSKVIIGILNENGGYMNRSLLIEEGSKRLNKGRTTVFNLLNSMKQVDKPIINEKGRIVALITK